MAPVSYHPWPGAAQRLSEILAVLIEDRRGSWSC